MRGTNFSRRSLGIKLLNSPGSAHTTVSGTMSLSSRVAVDLNEAIMKNFDANGFSASIDSSSEGPEILQDNPFPAAQTICKRRNRPPLQKLGNIPQPLMNEALGMSHDG